MRLRPLPTARLLRKTFDAPAGTPAHDALQVVTPAFVRDMARFARGWLSAVRAMVKDGFGENPMGEWCGGDGFIPSLTRTIEFRGERVSVFTQPLFHPGVDLRWHGAKCHNVHDAAQKEYGRFAVMLCPNALASPRQLLGPTHPYGTKGRVTTPTAWLAAAMGHELTHTVFPGEMTEAQMAILLSGKSSKAARLAYLHDPSELVGHANQARFEVMYARLLTPRLHRPTTRQAINRSPVCHLLRGALRPDLWQRVEAHVKRP